MRDKSLRIVHVSNFPTGLRLQPYSTVEKKISNGLIRLGHLVVDFNDRDVARSKSIIKSKRFGRPAANKCLEDFCYQIRPDILLLGHASMITPQAIYHIRQNNPDIRIGQWTGDFLGSKNELRKIKEKQPVVDMTFVTSCGGREVEELKKFGRVRYLPNPVDFSIETGRADLLKNPSYDVISDCGNPKDKRSICGELTSIDDFINEMRKMLPRIKIKKLGGVPWNSHVTDARYHEIVSHSAIGLNISVATNGFLYSSDRIAHFVGNGCLVAIERSSGYEKLFHENEMLFFSNLQELFEKLDYYINHPSQRMICAQAGRRKYHQLFNERRVGAHIIHCLNNNVTSSTKDWLFSNKDC